ncbi:MAG TPA: nickel pincer cofactor biosynthesis protein LarC [Acidobacteriaceae bacterium]|nr:nickel pincer cofactor biosynthesis protein LarC [Acidobacteriaceae bacterium]
MNTARVECFAGISGDMLLGALIDAGVPAELLRDAASSLGIGAELRVGTVERNGMRATKVDVLEYGRIAEVEHHAHNHQHHAHEHGHHEHVSEEGHPHNHSRNWREIRELIDRTAIPGSAKAIAQRAFALLAEAEGKVHGIPPDQVHFHEVGAVDTIADIVCAAVGADWLIRERGVTKWHCSAVNVGSGFVNCAHGRMPVPAPATAELLRGVPTYSGGPAMELTTPTGAALLRALDCRFEKGPPFVADTIGYGAGSRDPEGFANVLRLSVGATASAPTAERGLRADRVVVLECAIDDAMPQVLAHAMDLALEQGALDAMAAPVAMKKGRLGTLLTLLCRPDQEDALTRLLFRETTTLGIRRREEERSILEREWVTVETGYGRIRVKIASAAGEVLNAMPEYEDCRRTAREHGIPLRTAMEAALAAYGELQRAKA